MKKVLKPSGFDMNKTTFTIVLLNVSALFILGGIALYSLVRKEFFPVAGYGIPVFLLIFITLFNSYITIRFVVALLREKEDYIGVKDSITQLENFNNTLRAQRHDFMNHLQVIYGLMEMGEYSDAKDYLERIYSDIQSVNRFLKTANPAVNALLQAKLLYAEDRGIRCELNISTQLSHLKIQSWEFCRVLGNIIDNAIYALKENEGDKALHIELHEDIKGYWFKVEDNGLGIPLEVMDKIFEPGFTTKGENGDGMGLSIVKGIVESSGGSILCTSLVGRTIFEGFIPREQ